MIQVSGQNFVNNINLYKQNDTKKLSLNNNIKNSDNNYKDMSYEENKSSKDIPFRAYYPINFRSNNIINNKEKLEKLSETIKSEDGKILLNYAHEKGILLNNDSEDKSTVLDNLYKIATEKRADGLDSEVLIKDLLITLAYPYAITQKFGNIPNEIREQVIKKASDTDAKTIDVKNSSCCVAASIEFSLAKSKPAEFARMAEGISSPKMATQKTIDLNILDNNQDKAKNILNLFNIPYKMEGANKACVTISPDKNAILRSNIQTIDRDAFERSPLDVLMQSTIMNIGSQQTYNTLNDKRKITDLSSNDTGLTSLEKTFAESIMTNTKRVSLIFQKLEEIKDKDTVNNRLVGYNTSNNAIKRALLNTLGQGDNVIIGCTFLDENNIIQGGHEITVTGAKITPERKLIFICNDTDNNSMYPTEIHEDILIPSIHHLNVPADVANEDDKLKQIVDEIKFS